MALTEVTVNFGVQGETGVRGKLLTILHHYTNRVCEGNRKWLHHRATPTQEMVNHHRATPTQKWSHHRATPTWEMAHHRATPTQEMFTSQGHTYPGNGYITGPHLPITQPDLTHFCCKTV